jgi:uncharacterized membrane protein
MATCTKCGAVLVEGSGFCGSCGTPVAAGSAAAGGSAPAAATSVGSSGLAPNIAAMLAYFTLIPAIIFLVVEPYNRDRYVRFHSFQSLFFHIAWIMLWIGMIFLGMALGVIPVVGWIIHILLDLALGLGGFILWVVLVIKAYGNQKFHLPVIGKMAEEQAAK